MKAKYVIATLIFTLTSAHSEIVVIGNTNGPALDKEAIVAVYLGKSSNATPIDLPESAQQRADFYSKVTGRDLTQIKSMWARLVFTGKTQPPKEYADVSAVKKAVAADPKAVGYIDKSAVDGSVKVLLDVK